MDLKKFFSIQSAGAFGGAALGVAIIGYNLSLTKSFLWAVGVFLIMMAIGKLFFR